MVLTQEMKDFVHLLAQAFAKAHGSEDPKPFGDVVLAHAIALSAPEAPAVETPAA